MERKQLAVVRGLHRVGGQLVFTEPKTRRSRRTIALSRAALDALQAHRKQQAEARLKAGPLWQMNDLVFCTSVGTPFKPTEASRAFKRALGVAQLPDVRLHDLRHTAATLLLGAGTPAKVVQEMLGHATIALTLDLYSHVTETMQQAAADVFDRTLAAVAK